MKIGRALLKGIHDKNNLA